MSYEQAVMKKHIFEQSVRGFLKYTAVMTNEEIEISMARLADILELDLIYNEEEKLHRTIKGALLFKYLECRIAGVVSQSMMKRVFHRVAMKEFYTEKGMQNHQLALEDHTKKRRMQMKAYNLKYKKHQLEYKKHQDEEKTRLEKHKKKSLLKRFFSPPELPPLPPLPPQVIPEPDAQPYIDNSVDNANMSEFLIAMILRFKLSNIPDSVDHYNLNQIKLLANG